MNIPKLREIYEKRMEYDVCRYPGSCGNTPSGNDPCSGCESAMMIEDTLHCLLSYYDELTGTMFEVVRDPDWTPKGLIRFVTDIEGALNG